MNAIYDKCTGIKTCLTNLTVSNLKSYRIAFSRTSSTRETVIIINNEIIECSLPNLIYANAVESTNICFRKPVYIILLCPRKLGYIINDRGSGGTGAGFWRQIFLRLNFEK